MDTSSSSSSYHPTTCTLQAQQQQQQHQQQQQQLVPYGYSILDYYCRYDEEWRAQVRHLKKLVDSFSKERERVEKPPSSPSPYPQKTKTKTGVQHLPDEAVRECMRYMDAASLLAACQVDRRWRLLANEEGLWTHVLRVGFNVDVRSLEMRRSTRKKKEREKERDKEREKGREREREKEKHTDKVEIEHKTPTPTPTPSSNSNPPFQVTSIYRSELKAPAAHQQLMCNRASNHDISPRHKSHSSEGTRLGVRQSLLPDDTDDISTSTCSSTSSSTSVGALMCSTSKRVYLEMQRGFTDLVRNTHLSVYTPPLAPLSHVPCAFM